jgi:predicted enzyme related to lactoylglutathione lyase
MHFGPVDMGDYIDFTMTPPGTKEAVAGVCHARGANADLPAQWLIYIAVEDLDQSLAACADLGGEILVPPRQMGEDRFGVIQDPAGAVCALYESAAEQ